MSDYKKEDEKSIDKIDKLVEEGIRNNRTLDEIKDTLSLSGYSEGDIDASFHKIDVLLGKKVQKTANKSFMSKKYFLDRIGFGIAANQFINVLFYLTGAGAFLVGIINAFKSGLSTIISSIFREYFQVKRVKKWIINVSGLLFGFSFLFIALAVSKGSVVLFAISTMLGSIGIVIYGDLYRKMQSRTHGETKVRLLSVRTILLGLIVSFIAMIGSAILMDSIPLTGKLFYLNIFGKLVSFRLHGFLLAFEATALAFILSSYILSKMNLLSEEKSITNREFIYRYYYRILSKGKAFFSNKYLFLLTLATLFTAVFQSVIYSLSGIYLFETFRDAWFFGFLNIAIIFGVPVLLSLLGPLIASRLNRILGLAPLLVFGSLLLAIFPLTVGYNDYFPAILTANILAVIGISMLGTAQGLLSSRLLNDSERHTFYSYSGIVTVIPFIVLAALILSLFSSIGIIGILKVSGFGIIVTLVPIYLILVFFLRKMPISKA